MTINPIECQVISKFIPITERIRENIVYIIIITLILVIQEIIRFETISIITEPFSVFYPEGNRSKFKITRTILQGLHFHTHILTFATATISSYVKVNALQTIDNHFCSRSSIFRHNDKYTFQT